jgi:hypothetical protein
LKQSIADWHRFALRPVLVPETGQEPIKVCYLCHQLISDAIGHRNSDAHRQAAETADWAAFDELRAQIDAALPPGDL